MAYFNPANELIANGNIRTLQGSNFNDLEKSLKRGEVLVAKYENLSFFVCPCLNSDEIFQQFERRYDAGEYLSRKYFAVPQDSANLL